MNKTRRSLTLSVLAAAFTSSQGALARAPFANTQIPGVHRMKFGEFEITSLSDGYTLMAHSIMDGDQNIIGILAREAHLPAGPIRLSVNAFLVNTGESLILIDSGAGDLMLKSMGHLSESMAAASVDPAQIDQVLITHMHGDHIGGTVTPDGKALYPNAVIRMGKADYDYWTSEENMDRAAERKVRFVASIRAAKVYGKRMQAFAPGTAIVPGIRSIDTAGHTPGHSSYMVESGSMRLLATGDLLHVAEVQFSRPEITVAYDSDPAVARRIRRTILDAAATEGWILAIPHAPFPGLGRVKREGASYLFEPVSWQLF
jgi:glyoxylase-like metal-dependent hydrolase (beta-lactamase superfamily II)